MQNKRLRKPSFLTMTVMVVIFLTIILWHRMVYLIPPGSTGVLWRVFGGTEKEGVYHEGLNFVLPWNRLYIYDNRLRRVDLRVEAFGNDGLNVIMDVTLDYVLDTATTPLLHLEIGPRYQETLLIPELTNALNHSITTRTGQDLYTIQRDKIEKEVLAGLKNRLNSYPSPISGEPRKYLSINTFIIREIDLPKKIVEAIEDKVAAKENLEMARYRKDAQEIEVASIKHFQDVIGPGITDGLLKWRGIDATAKLAGSSNTKIIVIGNPKNGMPIIFDGFEQKK